MNTAELTPAGTVTEGGVVKIVELSVRRIRVPPAGATSESVTVQAVPPLLETTVGLHCNPDIRAALKAMLADCVELFSEAVMAVVWLEVRNPAVTVKTAERLPAETATAAGILNASEVSAMVTLMPPAGAA
jgi:hypothetical protein